MIGILMEKNSALQNGMRAFGGKKGKFNGEDYILTASSGHLYEFQQPEEHVDTSLSKRYKDWNMDNLPWNEKDFSWKLKKKNGSKTDSLLQSIMADLSQCDEICIATDNDPSGEGSLLAWEIISELGLKAKFTRMFFVDESVGELQKAFVNRVPLIGMLEDGDYRKAKFRSKWDYLSIQWTRITSMQTYGKVLRQGRLKSAIVKLVGDQLERIKSYQKIPFYQNRFRDENGNMYTNDDEPLFKDKKDVPNIYHDSPVIIDSITTKESAPPKLLDLAGLAAILAGHGIKAKTVIETYQKMYEDQIVSYPRTEDKTITPEQFNELLPYITHLAKLANIDESILTHRTPRSTHVKKSGSHGANRPGLKIPNSLSDLDHYGKGAREIYVLLTKSYLTMLAENYVYERQVGHIEKYPSFIGSVDIPKFIGFKKITENMNESALQGHLGLGKVGKPFIHEGFPPKPQIPTTRWLMQQLGKRDVGTGATRTNVYADVTNEHSKYPLLIEKKGKLSMAECGELSYQLIQNTHIGDLSLTEKLTKQMKDVEQGIVDPDVYLHKIQQLIKDDIEVIKENRKNMKETNFKTKEKATGIWVKSGQEVSFNKEWSGHTFTDEEIQKLLNGEQITIRGLVSAKGNEYGVIGELQNQTFEGNAFVGFKNLGFAPNITLPKAWCQHEFSEDEKTKLLNGETIQLTDCVSAKTGNTFSCAMQFIDDGSGGKKLNPIFS